MDKIFIEVFKTTISSKSVGKDILNILDQLFPESRINIDYEDCDKILRIEGRNFEVSKVVEVVTRSGFYCEVLV